MLLGLIRAAWHSSFAARRSFALGLGRQLRRGLVCRQLHAGRDGRRSRRGTSVLERRRRVYRRNARLADRPSAALCGIDPLAIRCSAPLAGAEERRPGSGRRARRQILPLAIGVLVFLVIVFCVCACRTSSDPAALDRPALSVRVSTSIGAGAAAMLARSILRHDDYWPFHMVAADLRVGFRHARPVVLALHDSVRRRSTEAAAPMRVSPSCSGARACSYSR